MTTTYQDHYRLKPGYEPGGRAKYDSSESMDRQTPRDKDSSVVFKDIKSTKPTDNHKDSSEKAETEQENTEDSEVSEEDLGPPAIFYPLNPDWQRQKAKLLRIQVLRTMTYGSQKRFFSTTPPRKTEPVRGDGNCFFRAICAIITGAESEHMTVRKAVTQHVSDNPDMYRTFLESRGGMTKYLSSMKQSREWATDTEILATATLLKTVIMVYFPFPVGKRYEYRWQTFKPLNNPDITYPVIYLANMNEHFDPVLDVERESAFAMSSRSQKVDPKSTKVDPKSTKVDPRSKKASDKSWNKF